MQFSYQHWAPEAEHVKGDVYSVSRRRVAQGNCANLTCPAQPIYSAPVTVTCHTPTVLTHPNPTFKMNEWPQDVVLYSKIGAVAPIAALRGSEVCKDPALVPTGAALSLPSSSPLPWSPQPLPHQRRK